MAILELTRDTFDAEVLKAEKPVVLDLFATWCGPCRMLRPVLEVLSEKRQDVKFVSVDVDEDPEIAVKYGVSSIPCLVFLKDGQEVTRSVGYRPAEDLEALLKELV